MQLGERLKSARLASGLTLRELAQAVDLSATAISKIERGQISPRPSVIRKLIKALNLTAEYLYRETTVELLTPAYRKKSDFPKKLQVKIEENVKEYAERYLAIQELFSTERKNIYSLPKYTIDTIDEIEGIALEVRQKWELGTAPIDNLVSNFEDQGIIVLMVPKEDGFDGFSCWIDDQTPVVVCPDNVPGDRQRFTLAHELGHLILNYNDTLNMEEAANQFAASFLVPSKSLLYELGEKRSKLLLDELLILKQKYKVSMQVLVRRAYTLGIITKAKYQEICKMFSRLGWRTNEPGDDVDYEVPTRFNLLINQALAENWITPIRAQELARNKFDTFNIGKFKPEDDVLLEASKKLANVYSEDKEATIFTRINSEDILP